VTGHVTSNVTGNVTGKMTSGYFVTGTDTNVGKTVLSALLVAALDAMYWKPVQTGASEGTDRESVHTGRKYRRTCCPWSDTGSIRLCLRISLRGRREFRFLFKILNCRMRPRAANGLWRALAE